MLFILISWMYVVFTTVNFGVVCNKILGLKNKNLVITSFLGLFTITIFASIWAFFGRINFEFHSVLLLCNGFLFFKNKAEISESYKSWWGNIVVLSPSLKFFLTFTTLLILAQCSLLPYVIDNESYYIQTIKWFNEYGFVKGLANLHLYLGQASGWHVTQSVFNFSFLYADFNDLSGYCLFLGMLFSVEKLEKYAENMNLNHLLVGVFPLASIYFFQFINAPSPDIPIYVLTFVILFYFLENFKNCSSEKFNLIVILVLFVLYIKSTSLVLASLPFLLLIQNLKVLSKKLIVPGAVALLILVLFISKNMIISGSVLFPSKLFASFTTDYSIPKIIESNYYDNIKYFGYQVTPKQFRAMTIVEMLQHWVSMPKINGIFNKISILILLISPLFIYKFQNKKAMWMLYALMLFQLILLLATSPQYRFFMNFMLFFGLFCLICIVQNKKWIHSLLVIGLLPIVFLLFTPISLRAFTNNKFMLENNIFSVKMLLEPQPNTKMNTDFEVIELGNLKYHSPLENEFFFGTGNGNLPCVNKSQVEYYRKNFDLIPQMRTKELKDGFYSKKTATDE